MNLKNMQASIDSTTLALSEIHTDSRYIKYSEDPRFKARLIAIIIRKRREIEEYKKEMYTYI